MIGHQLELGSAPYSTQIGADQRVDDCSAVGWMTAGEHLRPIWLIIRQPPV